ncbi:HAD family hydrolase [Candidatus Woesearchaeota archaeon]|nr:MAG: HAD family hydrolase [Candidatus Woesearchaeota archaeon]
MRKFRLACFDLDGTLIDSPRSIWQLVHEKLGTDNEARKKVMKDFYEGRISYREWAEHDIMIWKKSGLRREKLMEIISSLKVMPGARETLAELKRKGIKLAVISGSLKDVLDYFFPETFDYV